MSKTATSAPNEQANFRTLSLLDSVARKPSPVAHHFFMQFNRADPWSS
ncbi:hypothetical protein SNOG_00383 [Parastagonospora nodorum SN15]|uniref:Uncharacterized protein n=1 Tax=Phaeosphaeria nodorum (strain SN15 / ATCC MYA-4574 / FGSC 10173) TaxID=321614 RepID=Q0V6I1_PHANO|nr:hypothetical protein SNOG_00383 [Parastagonospora nodorum SN15]EAT91878.1 hypothetical protein SNOG_00383 [Parastagonospora nodorum SN15]